MKKHYETHVEDTDKLISVAGPVLDYKSWYEQYRKLMEEQAQRKYGLYTPTSEGDDDDFPNIPGMIARYSALDLTNEQMKENPVWVDKTGNGHGLQMKNFLWGGMSGVGGYEMNFNSWTNNVPSISDISMSKTTSSVSVSVGNSAYNNNLIYIHKNNWDVNKNHWLKVASTYEDGDLAFIFYNNDKNTKKIELPANGYVNIPAYPEFKGSYMYISTTSNKQGSFTIEQLPLYPGAIVFDGVDDYGICENFPILTKEKGYTVVALRQFLGSRDSFLISNRVTGTAFYNGAFIFERFWEKSGAIFYNFGTPSDQLSLKPYSPFSYLTSKSYNGRATNAGDAVPSNTLLVGKSIINDSNSTNAAIWEICILDHDATEEELTKIKDYFVKTYPWLFPDQAWTVTGKTNEDEDRATIANITGNGNNLVLSNFGFAEGSGYNEEGEYAGYLVTDGVDDRVVSRSSFLFGNDFTVVGEWEFLQEDSYVFARFNKHYTYFVLYNYISGVNVYVKNGKGTSIRNTKTLKAVTSEGLIYTDFNSEQKVELADKVEADLPLYIAYNGNNYTKMAFKNLAIYPTILSKDDCIKAYNYLQTLKSK